MEIAQEKYINPFTDYGFKKLFGEESNKDLLLDFLNALLKEEQGQIVDLTYLKNEQLGTSEVDRKAIFDLFCENKKGEKFIVELQKSKQNFFKDRSVYYATFPIQEQAKTNYWSFRQRQIYSITILDFVFDDRKQNRERVMHFVSFKDQNGREFYKKLQFVYIELPKFNKAVSELHTQLDKWLYVLTHLSSLNQRPEKLQEQVFKKLFDIAEVAEFDQDERKKYESSLKNYRDLRNVTTTSFDDGIKEGLEGGA